MKLAYILIPMFLIAVVGAYTLPETTIKGPLSMDNHKIWDVAAPANDTDVAIRSTVTSAVGSYMPLSGGTFSSWVNFGSFPLQSVGVPVNDTDASTKKYVDDSIGAAGGMPLSGGTFTGWVNFGSFPLQSVGAPANDTDASTKKYVDDLSVNYASAAEGVTNGDSHDHVGGDGATIDHGGLGGRGDDDHPQYPLLVGRVGGQTILGGTGVADILKLQGTSGEGTAAEEAVQVIVGDNGGTVAATILNNGNVGIGTTAPGAQLGLYNTGSDSILTTGLKVTHHRNAVDRVVHFTGNEAAGYDFVMLQNGNVGIGTTVPTAKLAINGSLHVGGDSDPGDNNLAVDGNANISSYVYLAGIGAQDAPQANAIKFYSKAGIPYYRNTTGEYVVSGGEVSGGPGDVSGPASSVQNNFPSFADTGGKTLADSGTSGDTFVAASGDTMSGALAMGTNKITGVGNGTAAQDVVTYSQLQTKFQVQSMIPSVTLGPSSSGEQYDYYTDDVADEVTILNAAQSFGGRGRVYIDNHDYNFAGTLTVPLGVELVGMVPAIYGNGVLGGDNGFVANATARFCITNTTHTAVELTGGSGLNSIDFYYPNQVTNSSTPTVYPFTITLVTSGSQWPAHVTIRNCHLVNAYDFLNATVGHSHLVIDGLVGTAIHRGIYEDNGGHGDIYTNVHFLPHYGGQTLGNLLINYICENMIAFDIGINDNGVMSDCMCWNAGTGLKLSGTRGMKVDRCLFDTVAVPLLVTDSSFGNVFSQCLFAATKSAYNYAYVDTPYKNSSQRAIEISDTGSGGNIFDSNIIISGGYGIYNNGPRNTFSNNEIAFGYVDSTYAYSIGIDNVAGGTDSTIISNRVLGGDRDATLGIVNYAPANIIGNTVRYTTGTAYVDNAGDVAGKRYIDNVGINPIGDLTEPAANPVSNTVYTNYFGCPVLITVSGGTVSQIAINAANTGLTSGAFTLGPDNTIKITHSGNPVWTWTGL
jgi:hypothetical protein